jgi:cysteine desulfuration protein SufE
VIIGKAIGESINPNVPSFNFYFSMSLTSNNLPANLAKIVERFQRHTDPKKRYEQLLWYAKKLDAMPEESKIPENKVHGCTSQVYITADLKEGKIWYQGDSDAQLVKGLVALLIQGLNGLSPAEILALTPDFIEATGLQVSLTPSRANGFYNIFNLMKKKALGFQLGESVLS